MIAARGTVLGIDVGFSETGRTTGLCLLTWSDHELTWQTAVTGTADGIRAEALRQLLQRAERLEAVAIDGPIRPGLVCVPQYRCSESLLSRGIFQRRGKPGASHFGSGWKLHCAATAMAELVVRVAGVRSDVFVEAFPNGFLAVLHDDDGFPRAADVRRRWTDVLYPRPSVRKALALVVADAAPGRAVTGDWDFAGSSRSDVHEKRSALVCALTALCVAAGRSVLVGAAADGFIHLPPRTTWGRGAGGGVAWAEAALRKNVEAARSSWRPLVYSDGRPWLPA